MEHVCVSLLCCYIVVLWLQVCSPICDSSLVDCLFCHWNAVAAVSLPEPLAQPKAKAKSEKTKPPEETPVEAIAEDQPRTQKGKHAKAISPVPVGAQCTIIPWASYQAQQARPEDGVIPWASTAAPKRARSEPEEPTLQRSKYRLPKTSIEPTGSAGSTDAPEFNMCHG